MSPVVPQPDIERAIRVLKAAGLENVARLLKQPEKSKRAARENQCPSTTAAPVTFKNSVDLI